MAEYFLGEIRVFAGNYAPRHWAFCDGQILDIVSYNALFSLLGTYYGGDGRSTFALPDFRGRVAMGMGTGPGLSDRHLGARFGLESVQLTADQMPNHTHTMQASNNSGDNVSPGGKIVGHGANKSQLYYNTLTDPSRRAEFQDGTVLDTGANEAHPNMMPGLVLNYIIAVEGGAYPSRT